MFAIMYDENRIVKIDCTNEDEFKNYKQVQTFSEGRKELIQYWDMVKSNAAINIKEAKNMREG